MLSTDNIILEILNTEKQNGNPLLQDFHILHPSKRVAEESNSIFVACVSSENNLEGYDFTSFRDLVEILIVTKQLDYSKAIMLIKTITTEICRLILKNQRKFPNKPVIRNINPEYNHDYVLNRGHIMVECKTEPVSFEVNDEDYRICEIILNEIKEE